MYEGSQYAARLPFSNESTLDTFFRVKNYQNEQERAAENQRRYAEQKETQMAQYLAQTLDFDKYATGTVYDPIILQTQQEDLKNIASKMKDGNYSYAQMVYDAADAAGRINKFSTTAKTVSAQIKEQAKQFAGDKSVDHNMWEKTAKLLAFGDGKGGVRPIEDVVAEMGTVDYFEEAGKRYPELISQGTQGIDAMVKEARPRDYTRGDVMNQGLVKRKVKYGGKYYSFNELVDAQGKPVDPDDHSRVATGVRVRGEALDKEGKIRGVDNEVYSQFATPSNKVAMNLAAKRAGIDPNSEQGEMFKRAWLYDHLDRNGGYINLQDKDYDDSRLILHEQRQHDAQQRRLDRQANGAGGKPSTYATVGKILSGQYDGDVGEDGLVNVTPYLANGQFFSGRNVKKPDGGSVKDAYNAVKFNPKTRELFTVEDEYEFDKDGKQIMVLDKSSGTRVPKIKQGVPQKVTDYKKFVRLTAEANGVSPDKAEQDFNGSYTPVPGALPPKPPAPPKKKTWLQNISDLNPFK